ncbi:hypothetical protein [Marinithermofilum abyssi]|uniref:hypothetical protein n=1 Tax=Marinithermofilum abyssi TaxID=1571185 RepID=UPI001669EFC1|nr:hypothetical protein [Marinithermofilum abyssi]
MMLELLNPFLLHFIPFYSPFLEQTFCFCVGAFWLMKGWHKKSSLEAAGSEEVSLYYSNGQDFFLPFYPNMKKNTTP